MSEVTQVDTSKVAKLLGVNWEEIVRPHGKIDFFVGSDYCGVLPRIFETG